MEQRRNERVEETGYLRENPPASGIVDALSMTPRWQRNRISDYKRVKGLFLLLVPAHLAIENAEEMHASTTGTPHARSKALRLAAMAHLTCVAVSPLSLPVFSDSNAETSSRRAGGLKIAADISSRKGSAAGSTNFKKKAMPPVQKNKVSSPAHVQFHYESRYSPITDNANKFREQRSSICRYGFQYRKCDTSQFSKRQRMCDAVMVFPSTYLLRYPYTRKQRALHGHGNVALIAPAILGLVRGKQHQVGGGLTSGLDRHVQGQEGEGAIRATRTRTPGASSLLRARSAVFPSTGLFQAPAQSLCSQRAVETHIDREKVYKKKKKVHEKRGKWVGRRRRGGEVVGGRQSIPPVTGSQVTSGAWVVGVGDDVTRPVTCPDCRQRPEIRTPRIMESGELLSGVFRHTSLFLRRATLLHNYRIACSTPLWRSGFNTRPGHPGISHVGIVPDDTVGRRVFSGISRFPRPFISALLHTHLNHTYRVSRPRRCVGATVDASVASLGSGRAKRCVGIPSGDLETKPIWPRSLECPFYRSLVQRDPLGQYSETAIVFITYMTIFYLRRPQKYSLYREGDHGGRVTGLLQVGSCQTIAFVGGFSRGSPVSPAPSFRRCSIHTSITLIGSKDFDAKSRPNLSTLPISSAIGRAVREWLRAADKNEISRPPEKLRNGAYIPRLWGNMRCNLGEPHHIGYSLIAGRSQSPRNFSKCCVALRYLFRRIFLRILYTCRFLQQERRRGRVCDTSYITAVSNSTRCPAERRGNKAASGSAWIVEGRVDIEVLRADEGETRRPAASSGTIPTGENLRATSRRKLNPLFVSRHNEEVQRRLQFVLCKVVVARGHIQRTHYRFQYLSCRLYTWLSVGSVVGTPAVDLYDELTGRRLARSYFPQPRSKPLPSVGRHYCRNGSYLPATDRIYPQRIVSTRSGSYLPAADRIYRQRIVSTRSGSYLPATDVYMSRTVVSCDAQ
ncbi:hypothetical protein PR048_019014, partial [Dryococelus australis]